MIWGHARLMRKLGIVGCIVVIAASLSAPAAAVSTEELAGDTLVTGAGTSVMSVVLPAPVRLRASSFDNPFASISADGRLGGVVLRQEGVYEPVEVMALSIDPCDKTPCSDPRFDFVSFYRIKRQDGKVRLPAGRYLLYLLSDGARVNVRLNLPGLPGSVRMQPSDPVKSEVADLEAGPTGDDAKVTYSASADHTVRKSGGLSIVALEVETDTHVVGRYGACVTRKLDEAPISGTGLCGGWIFATPTTPAGRAIVVGLAPLTKGNYTHSVNFQGAALMSSATSFGFVLDYANESDNYSTHAFSFEENP